MMLIPSPEIMYDTKQHADTMSPPSFQFPWSATTPPSSFVIVAKPATALESAAMKPREDKEVERLQLHNILCNIVCERASERDE